MTPPGEKRGKISPDKLFNKTPQIQRVTHSSESIQAASMLGQNPGFNLISQAGRLPKSANDAVRMKRGFSAAKYLNDV